MLLLKQDGLVHMYCFGFSKPWLEGYKPSTCIFSLSLTCTFHLLLPGSGAYIVICPFIWTSSYGLCLSSKLVLEIPVILKLVFSPNLESAKQFGCNDKTNCLNQKVIALSFSSHILRVWFSNPWFGGLKMLHVNNPPNVNRRSVFYKDFLKIKNRFFTPWFFFSCEFYFM